jgi:hypothetical protein
MLIKYIISKLSFNHFIFFFSHLRLPLSRLFDFICRRSYFDECEAARFISQLHHTRTDDLPYSNQRSIILEPTIYHTRTDDLPYSTQARNQDDVSESNDMALPPGCCCCCCCFGERTNTIKIQLRVKDTIYLDWRTRDGV